MSNSFYKNPTLSGSVNIEEKPEPLPSHVGKYKIESLLNRGSTSLLYLAVHPETHEPIAIKVLSSKYITHPEVVDRFLKEAAIIELTNHPNIVKLYGHGKWERGLYIAMEFIQGLSLRQMILQEAMSLKRALDIVLQIAQALVHLHAYGIIHRDLKPENILLTAQGGVKVIDFGISQIYSEQGSKVAPQVVGTPVYMSPEQQANPIMVDYKTDIYSLGVITYELILGRLSFGVIHLSHVPRGLQKILSKALQPKPEDRYVDIVDFITDLSKYLSSNNFKRDRRSSDYLGELNESLKEAQTLLVPTTAPTWPRVDMALISNCNTTLSSVYYDFFHKQGAIFQIAMGESLSTGVEGLLHIATLKGMVRAFSLTKESPVDLVSSLNECLIEDRNNPFYSFSLLSLFPSEDRFSYISCGYSPLWYVPNGSTIPRQITANNVALGITPQLEFIDVDSTWNIGDKLILHTFQAGLAQSVDQVEQNEKAFLETLSETLFLSPKTQTETIFRKLTQKEKKEQPVTVITIARVI